MGQPTQVLPPDTESVLVGYKEPLTPVQGGFGHYGTIAYDKGRRFTQCHICGFFYKRLGNHINATHKMKVRNYRISYGLGLGTSLTAPITRAELLQTWFKRSKRDRGNVLKNLKAGRDSVDHETRLKGGAPGKSLLKRNLEGKCPEQLLNKVALLKDHLKRVPTMKEFEKTYGQGYMDALQVVFGSWGEALKILGLEARSSGSKYGYSKVALLRMLNNFQAKYGREPVSSDCRTGLLPSVGTYIKYFGSWNHAKELMRKEQQ